MASPSKGHHWRQRSTSFSFLLSSPHPPPSRLHPAPPSKACSPPHTKTHPQSQEVKTARDLSFISNHMSKAFFFCFFLHCFCFPQDNDLCFYSKDIVPPYIEAIREKREQICYMCVSIKKRGGHPPTPPLSPERGNLANTSSQAFCH